MGQVKSGQVRLSWVESGWVRLGQVKSGKVGWMRTRQEMLAPVKKIVQYKSMQVKSSLTLLAVAS